LSIVSERDEQLSIGSTKNDLFRVGFCKDTDTIGVSAGGPEVSGSRMCLTSRQSEVAAEGRDMMSISGTVVIAAEGRDINYVQQWDGLRHWRLKRSAFILAPG
jgi:hypothetical protein